MQLKNLLKLSCFLLVCFFALPAMAQNTVVTGRVTDSKDNSPLPGVSIVAKSSTIGTVTDGNGNFRLSVPPASKTIVISFIGYTSQEIAVTGSPVNVALVPTTSTLNDVLVVGYGTVRKKDATGAVVKVSSGDFVQGVTTNPLQQLQGKAAGVVITTTDGDPNSAPVVRIRGTASLSGGNDPLYVIDGIEGADIRSVSPNDIESFDVLKDASAAAIYGSRAAGGVILVTTKTGKAGKSQVTFNTYAAAESPERLPDFMNRSQYLAAYQSYYGHSMPVFTAAAPSTTSDQGANTNWFKEITRTSLTHNENLAVSGGTEKSHYRGSLTYYDQEGIVRNTGRKDLNGRFNFDQKTLNDKLLITMNVSASHTDERHVDGGVFLDAASVPSVISVYDPLSPGNYQLINNTQEANPVPQLLDIINTVTNDRMTGNLRLDYTIVKGLTISPYANGTRGSGTGNVYYPATPLVQPIPDVLFGFTPQLTNHGDVDKGSNTYNTETYGAYLNYKGVFGQSRLNLTGGGEHYQTNYQGIRTGAHDFNDIDLPNENIGAANAITTKDIGSYYNGYVLKSLFGRVEYNFADKYYFTGNVRYDDSNKLGINNQSQVFPSGSVAWALNNEDFMKSVNWITLLKLRGGYGQVGNQDAIGAYTSQNLFGPNGKLYYDGATGSFLPSNFAVQNANPSLRWEVNTTTDIAIDFGLFNGRLNGSVDVYNKKTTHLLYTYPVPLGGTFFVNNILANVGSLGNKGIEFNLNYKAVATKDFSWTPAVNFGLNRNKILTLTGQFAGTTFSATQANVGSTGGTGISGAISNIGYLKVGYPVGTLLLPQYAGMDNKGNQLFYKYNSDGTRTTVTDPTTLNLADDGSTQDRKFYTTDPKFTYSISNNFTYKQFDLSIFMRGQYGSHNFNETYMDYTSLQKLGTYAVLADATKYGIKSSSEPSTYWLQGSSFLKIQSTTLGYNINFQNNNYIDKIHVYVAGNNLYTITKYKGLDPEITTTGGLTGIDTRSLYPRPRQLSFGVNLTLK